MIDYHFDRHCPLAVPEHIKSIGCLGRQRPHAYQVPTSEHVRRQVLKLILPNISTTGNIETVIGNIELIVHAAIQPPAVNALMLKR